MRKVQKRIRDDLNKFRVSLYNAHFCHDKETKQQQQSLLSKFCFVFFFHKIECFFPFLHVVGSRWHNLNLGIIFQLSDSIFLPLNFNAHNEKTSF